VLVYRLACSTAHKGTFAWWKGYASSFAIALVLGVIGRTTLGTHTENDDPIYGGGDRVVDYIPTREEQDRAFYMIFGLTALPALIGTHVGLAKREADSKWK